MKYVYIRIDSSVRSPNVAMALFPFKRRIVYMYVCVYACNKTSVILVRTIYVIIHNEKSRKNISKSLFDLYKI